MSEIPTLERSTVDAPPATARWITTIANLGKTFVFYVGGVFWIALWAYLIPVPIAIVERLLGRKEPRLGLTILHRWIRVTGIFWRMVAEVAIDDEARAPEGSVVVVCNHHSFADIYLLLHVFPRVRFSAKRSLFRIPFLGWAMSILGHFPHEAGDPSSALDVASTSLRAGRYVALFPEGTRAPGGVIGEFRAGAFRVAQAAGRRIQPVVVVGTDRVWPRGGRFIRHLGPVKMKVLPAIDIDPSLGRQALRARIEEIRASMLEEHRRIERELFG